MSEAILKLAPVVLTFGLGILMRTTGVMKRGDGEIVLKIVFYASLPALVLLTALRG